MGVNMLRFPDAFPSKGTLWRGMLFIKIPITGGQHAPIS